MSKLTSLPVWVLATFCWLVLAAILSFPGAFGFVKTEQVAGIESSGGFLLSAKLPHGIGTPQKRDYLFPDPHILVEDGKALGRPKSSEKQITNAGRGRYQFSGSKIQFSTSDGASPEGRTYTIKAPVWSVREPLLMVIWLLGMVAVAITMRLAMRAGAIRPIENQKMAPVILFASLVFFVVIFSFASPVCDLFFLGLFVPGLWAVLMGAAALQRHVAGRAALVILALLPALAGYFYYGLNAASDSSFLVAGIIPCSDAWLHFLQSAEIAIQGTTQVLFNGRILYPAFYAVMLDVTGLNILVANFLVSSLVMLGLALTCSLVARRIGFAGTAIYCLLFWLYFRAHGCGLVMTENLGVLLGVLGLGFLFLSVDSNKTWAVFVSLLFFGLGSVARPGALFILPALALYAGIRVWMAPPARFRTATAVGAFILALMLAVGCFGANQMVLKSLTRGEGKTFGNFAFTLHGLLNGTKWRTSAEETGWNTSLVMERNIRQIKESPGSLVRGVGRAYGEMLKKGFLFRFGKEKRFASTGMAMFFLATLACWLWPPLRRDSGWILLSVAGILASVPFAPPWDAGERPYAVTEPLQIFLAAAGVTMLLDALRRLAAVLLRDPSADFCQPPAIESRSGLIGFSVLCLVLVLPVPLILKWSGYRHSLPAETPAFLHSSQRLIAKEGEVRDGCLSRAQFLDRLSDFQAEYPNEARVYTSEPGNFLIAINWSKLEAVVRPGPDHLPVTDIR